ncbi:hypothetical protein LOTGIDRAFT_109014 [Lottia gigantea]|uniref:Potassium channel domain-containing protein n=1 Tax=Lottia gigantea TaxID=225164 RepID=V3YX38_LOTGI|nr:hypothetical protein LOTGIDRAFT_109014 [Lottia gigantea]ESO82628.1 hypothetical protein LOTGIDRAFT_109014 [Lottia gigantea]
MEANTKSDITNISTQRSGLGTILNFFKLIYGLVKSVVGLMFILTLYSVIGAYIFLAIESSNEQVQKNEIKFERQGLIMVLKNMTFSENTTDNEDQLNKLLINYETNVINAYRNGMTASSTGVQWHFQSAVFYCLTVYTTIGYGCIVPVTSLGRSVTIVYALIGIPLALVILAKLGKKFTWWIKFMFALGCKIFRKTCGRCNKVVDSGGTEFKDVPNGTEVRPGVKVYFGFELDTEFNLNLFWALLVSLAYIFLGAVMYSHLENWTYLEAAYYIFISISTIGFGDLVSTNRDYFVLYSIYIFFGLSLISMCINVAIDVLTKQIQKAKIQREKIKEKLRGRRIERGKAIAIDK